MNMNKNMLFSLTDVSSSFWTLSPDFFLALENEINRREAISLMNYGSTCFLTANCLEHLNKNFQRIKLVVITKDVRTKLKARRGDCATARALAELNERRIESEMMKIDKAARLFVLTFSSLVCQQICDD